MGLISNRFTRLSGFIILSGLALSAPGFAKTPVAHVSQIHGDVFKRDFVDWNRELWADPTPAKDGDELSEGMQVGTGDKSWAQVKWPYLTSRAWANTVYAVAPNQRLVYLINGEMLQQLDKHRKDKKEYVVWTKLVQARFRGTTVLFQATPHKTRLTVLEGTVDVFNRLDKSVIRLKPGVVYEATDKLAEQDTPENAVSQTSWTNIVAPGASPVKVFQTDKTDVSLSLIDVTSLLNLPLITTIAEPLKSLSLVQTELGKLPPVAPDIATNLIKDNAQIVAVPMSMPYTVGPSIGKDLTLPAAALNDFPPVGRLDGNLNVSGISNSSTVGTAGDGTRLPSVGAQNSATYAAGAAGTSNTSIPQTSNPVSLSTNGLGTQLNSTTSNVTSQLGTLLGH